LVQGLLLWVEEGAGGVDGMNEDAFLAGGRSWRGGWSEDGSEHFYDGVDDIICGEGPGPGLQGEFQGCLSGEQQYTIAVLISV
jgi:hypothetical protein